MRASALKAWAEKEKDLGIEVAIHQTLEGTHGLYAFGVWLYNIIQRKAPFLHHLYFNWLECFHVARHECMLLGKKRYLEVLDREKPDLIVSTHAHLNHAFFKAARQHAEIRLHCGTYCGELFGGYGFSRHWVSSKADFFIGAVTETCTEATRLGMPQRKIHQGGFLLLPTFWAPPISDEQKISLLRELNLDPFLFTLLLSTGAQGANNHLPFLDALASSGLRLQVIALCGKEEATLTLVQSWAKEHPEFPVRALPFSNRMHELKQAVSATVIRPGTGSTSESILAGCPILLNGVGGVMPQECITVKYCHQHGIGPVIRRPSDLPTILRPWIESPETLAQQRSAMIAARPPGHPRQILETLLRLAS